MATQTELAEFLQAVERRAYRQAQFAIRDTHLALDIVQDAMMRLAEKYAHKPAAELPLLFHRILQNAIRDFHRRQRVRSMWTVLVSNLIGEDRDEQEALDAMSVEAGNQPGESPESELSRSQTMAIIERELGRLPARQREAFLLRYWEDFNIAETAEAMGCSEGSVKTHCARAVAALSKAMRGRKVTL